MTHILALLLIFFNSIIFYANKYLFLYDNNDGNECIQYKNVNMDTITASALHMFELHNILALVSIVVNDVVYAIYNIFHLAYTCPSCSNIFTKMCIYFHHSSI